MLTKLSSLIVLLAMSLGLMGVPKDVKEILFFLTLPAISYLFAIKLNLIPSKYYLNYRSILYFIWLIKEIIISSWSVMKIIWRWNLNLQPVFEWIDHGQKNDIALLIYANSITLTPGTVTLDVSENMLLIHALDKSSIDSLKYNNLSMSKRVQKITKNN